MEKIMTTTPKALSLSEDWTVVLIGGLLIGIALLGFSIPSPVFAWKITAELAEKVGNEKIRTNPMTSAMVFLVMGKKLIRDFYR